MNTNNETHEFFATCAKGLEDLLAGELRDLGLRRIRPLSNGVAFFGNLEDGMRACLWLRSASRVLLILTRVNAQNADALYSGLYRVPWENHIAPTGTLAIDAFGRNDELRNSQFIAMRAKDAIVDRVRNKDKEGRRPSVQKKKPDLRINLNVRKDKATIALDLSGEPLHKRGYRMESPAIKAPLKENLAAAMLLASGWSAAFSQKNNETLLLDPYCGSGTIAIEAALIASDRAPGLLRDHWGFSSWLGFNEDTWFKLLDEADERADAGVERLNSLDFPLVYAHDADSKALAVAQKSAQAANLSKHIHFSDNFSTIEPQVQEVGGSRFLVTNPPYGQRLSSEVQLPAVYAELTRYLRELRTSSSDQDLSVSVISPDALLEKYLSKELKRSPFKRIKTMNGPIALDICTWKTREQTKAVSENSEKSDGEEREESAKKTRSNEDDSTAQPSGRQKLEPSPDLSDLDVSAFKNRLAKMTKHRRKWAKRNEVSCYRVYDADLPDFNVAIDLYQGACGSKNDGEKWIHIAEYRAPKNIDEDKAHARLAEVLRVVPKQFETPSKNVFLKQRQQERGGSQYQQKNSRQTSDTFLIEEAGLKFEVDLSPRLDTGIFLDHRIVRSLLREKAKDRDCLNLFAYTGTASVYMADGGARSVTTLDLSSTYLDWAQRNMSLNGFDRRRDLQLEFERADALRWVKEQRALRKPSYDLIFVDVPTFSNSSKMVKQSWDVQRDHVEFLIGVSRLLRHGGEAIFSANLRSFKPDLDALRTARVSLEDISKQTVPQDFERSPNIHHSFILRKEAPL